MLKLFPSLEVRVIHVWKDVTTALLPSYCFIPIWPLAACKTNRTQKLPDGPHFTPWSSAVPHLNGSTSFRLRWSLLLRHFLKKKATISANAHRASKPIPGKRTEGAFRPAPPVSWQPLRCTTVWMNGSVEEMMPWDAPRLIQYRKWRCHRGPLLPPQFFVSFSVTWQDCEGGGEARVHLVGL